MAPLPTLHAILPANVSVTPDGGSSHSSSFAIYPAATVSSQAMSTQATLDFFMLVFASFFLFLSATLLRTFPMDASAVRGRSRWSLRPSTTLGGVSETNALRAYVTIPYGASAVSDTAVPSSTLSSRNMTVAQIVSLAGARDRHEGVDLYGLAEGTSGEAQHEVGTSYEDLVELADRLGPAKSGLSDDHIRLLPTYVCQDAAVGLPPPRWTHLSCVICRDDFAKGDIIRQLPCGDEFHADCIHPWLVSHATCPLCRTRFA